MFLKSKIKIMLLGIALMLFGIYFRGLFIGYLYNFFIELIWIVFPIVGFLVILYGFFSEEPKEELNEKIYSILLEQKSNEEKTLICRKCGEEYKEVYTSCPWCGYKEN